MPTYDYECSECGHELEEFQMMSEKPLKKCPACKKNELKRLIGAGAGIIFKGSGFYETDYKKASSSSSSPSSSSSESSSKESETKSSETKSSSGTSSTESKKASSGASDSKSKSK